MLLLHRNSQSRKETAPPRGISEGRRWPGVLLAATALLVGTVGPAARSRSRARTRCSAAA